jgi:hypothetical protein
MSLVRSEVPQSIRRHASISLERTMGIEPVTCCVTGSRERPLLYASGNVGSAQRNRTVLAERMRLLPHQSACAQHAEPDRTVRVGAWDEVVYLRCASHNPQRLTRMIGSTDRFEMTLPRFDGGWSCARLHDCVRIYTNRADACKLRRAPMSIC